MRVCYKFFKRRAAAARTCEKMPRSTKTKPVSGPYVPVTRELGLGPAATVDAFVQRLKADPNRPLDNPATLIVVNAPRYRLTVDQSFVGVRVFVIWPPKGVVAFALGDEVHFFCFTPQAHAYIMPRDSSARADRKRLRRKPASVVAHLELDGVTSTMALCYGEQMTIDEYGQRYADRVWLPTTQEYLAWMAELDTGGGLAFTQELPLADRASS